MHTGFFLTPFYMQDYLEISFENVAEEQVSILIALLSSIGYDGFLESTNSLKAYIVQDHFKEPDLLKIVHSQGLSFSSSVIKAENWNAKWESDFEPVLVDDFVCIRASFHSPDKKVLHDIIVTPKMSFGTGHHATTQLMVRLMRDLDFSNKHVFDFGTGTGVLAILAEKLGARKVLAIDNDSWSVENAAENVQANGCKTIEIVMTDKPPMEGSFDILLANINKSILLRFMAPLRQLLTKNGQLLLSGLLEDDEEDIIKVAEANSLKMIGKKSHHGWLALKLAQE